MHQNLEMNAIEIYKKKLLSKKTVERAIFDSLLSYSITQFYFDRIQPELDYKL